MIHDFPIKMINTEPGTPSLHYSEATNRSTLYSDAVTVTQNAECNESMFTNIFNEYHTHDHIFFKCAYMNSVIQEIVSLPSQPPKRNGNVLSFSLNLLFD